eukprot:256614-Lingulodinium_polyedra.AAC.1
MGTDYAGCKETRKPTSRGVISLGSHLIKGWSNVQPMIVLSAGTGSRHIICHGDQGHQPGHRIGQGRHH